MFMMLSSEDHVQKQTRDGKGDNPEHAQTVKEGALSDKREDLTLPGDDAR